MKTDTLGIEIAVKYGISSGTAMEAVDTYVGQLQDEDLYNTETEQLTDAGAEVVRAQFAEDHLEPPTPGTVAAEKEELRAGVRTLTEGAADLRARADEMTSERDALVRKGIELKVRIADLADDAGVKPARIYQIRDGRR